MNPTFIINRVKNILLAPATEWKAIASEQATPASLYQNYIVPLALIGPVAGFIGSSLLVGMAIHHVSIVAGVVGAIVGFALNLAAVFVVALIVDALAPTFSGTKNSVQALKVVAYSNTPGWIAGILMLVPILGFLAFFAALYGFYLLYLGLPVLMKAPQEKAVAYTIVVVVVSIVVFVVVGAITSAITAIAIF